MTVADISPSTFPPLRRALPLSAPQTVVLLIVAGSIIRVLISAVLGLGIDESYTVGNARVFDLSYVDYPPLHVWLTGAWAWLWHSENPLVLRLPFIAAFAGSTWLMYRLTAFHFGDRAGLWAALLLNLAPAFTLPFGSWILPDGPLCLFMLAASLVISRTLFASSEPQPDVRRWMLAGALCGLAMLTKYHGIFVPAATFLFLLTWRPGRTLLAHAGPWAGAAVVLAMFAPVLWWNVHHDWAGLFFQSQRLSKSTGLALSRPLTSIMAQAAYLSPWLFVPLCIALARALRRGPRDPQAWFFALLAIGPIAFFTIATIWAKGLPHWSMPGWLFAFPLLGRACGLLLENYRRQLRQFSVGVAAFLISAVTLVAVDARSGFVARAMPAKWAATDPTLDMLDWRELNAELSQRQLLNGDTAAVAGLRWYDAGKLNYTMGNRIPVLCLCSDPQEFRFLHDIRRFEGRSIVVIAAPGAVERDWASLSRHLSAIRMLAPVTIHRNGAVALHFLVLRGIYHQTPPAQGISIIDAHKARGVGS